jgi:hypothetical protein
MFSAPAVQPVAAGVGHHPELRRKHYRLASAPQGAADEFFVDEGAVNLGRVDQVHAEVDRAVDGAYRFRVVAPGTCVGERHSHGAQTQARHTEIAEMGALHEPVAMVVGSCRAGPVTATVVNVAAASSAGNVADSMRATPRSLLMHPLNSLARHAVAATHVNR